MTKTRFLALLSVLALLAAMPLATVLAQQPVPPNRFYGSVMIDGAPAPEDTMVTASITVVMEGEEGEEPTEEMMQIGEAMVDALGNYILMTMASATYLGKEIMFMIGEQDAMGSKMMDDGSMMMMEDPITYMQGETTNLDLSAGSMTSRPGTGGTGTGTSTGGTPGRPGAKGAPGEMGAAGEMGPAGAKGATGAKGAAGAMGPEGPAGPKGDGARGAAGSDGRAGSDGSDGSDGPRGPAGAKGAAGAAGADGPAGAAGRAGAAGADGGGLLAIIALIVAIVGVLAAGGAFMAGRRG